ncbi:Fic family protein [Rhizomicrobium palustre]|uniref:Fic family protein n=1 Tax=Rhizomicrobium palustre TaxID=189966 RepID=A0A846MUX9_9PROT|nr:Fic family protein [Rhizomicrobium palustre]NIK86880.1 Fic family protein [Rhizomicrobium palustre]
MIYPSFALDGADLAVLALIRAQQDQLLYRAAQLPGLWPGFLQRNAFARTLHGSASLAGIKASPAEALAVVDGEKPESLTDPAYRALSGTRNALRFISQAQTDPYLEWNAQLFKSLHFLLTSEEMPAAPGQYRSGASLGGGSEPDAADLPKLMGEVMDYLREDTGDPLVRAALVHLKFLEIRPFRRANARLARLAYVLIASCGSALSPVFCALDEWLARHKDDYVQQCITENGPGAWLKFILRAQYEQTAQLAQRSQAVARAAEEVMHLSRTHDLHDRMQPALLDAVFGYMLRAGRYQSENGVSDVVASRDLRRLCDLGLLEAVGEKRGRYYLSGEPLKQIQARVRLGGGTTPNPYDLVQETGV